MKETCIQKTLEIKHKILCHWFITLNNVAYQPLFEQYDDMP
jgi:hypothetical protein